MKWIMKLPCEMKDSYNSNIKSKKAKKPVKVVLKKVTTKELLANRIPSYGYIL